MDLQRRAALLDRLRDHGLDDSPPRAGMALPLVGLDDFFEGNDDARSIGPQISGAHPGVAAIHATLCSIAGRDDVSHVLVQARDARWAYDSDDEWVVAGCVVIVTAAAAADIDGWKQSLGCTAAAKGFPEPPASNAPALPEGHAAWQLVWT
jgi:hypothetical protein